MVENVLIWISRMYKRGVCGLIKKYKKEILISRTKLCTLVLTDKYIQHDERKSKNVVSLKSELGTV